jgi:hypothetical protein
MVKQKVGVFLQDIEFETIQEYYREENSGYNLIILPRIIPDSIEPFLNLNCKSTN